jgi:hypothetical protein
MIKPTFARRGGLHGEGGRRMLFAAFPILFQGLFKDAQA